MKILNIKNAKSKSHMTIRVCKNGKIDQAKKPTYAL